MHKISSLLILMIASFSIYGQCNYTLKPGPAQGKDANVRYHSCSVGPTACDTTNWGNTPVYYAASWTGLGSPKDDRGLMEFDLSAYDSTCTISKAILTLYHDGNPNDHCGTNTGWHPCQSNEITFHRVLGPWNEATVTGSTQPSFANNIPGIDYVSTGDSSGVSYATYHIDLTEMVQYWIQHPDSNFGFVMKMVTEFSPYRNVRFASSDHADSTLWPELTLEANCPGTNCNTLVQGYIFDDLNLDCAQDSNSFLMQNNIVIIEPGPTYTSTDALGYYSAYLAEGNYTITPGIRNNFLLSDSCNPNASVTVGPNDTLIEVNFPLQAENYCAELTVDIGVARIRKCHEEWFKVAYCNNGNLAEDSVYILVDLDDYLIVDSATIPFVQSGQSLRFDIGSLQPYECGFFNIACMVDCSVPFNITLCSKASIYPVNYCEVPDASWDKSSVKVTGECKADSNVCFTILNTGEFGNGNMDGTSVWRLYENNVLIQTGNFQLTGQESLELCFSGNGNTLRLEADQRPGHPGHSKPRASIESCGTGTGTVVSSTTVAEDDDDVFVSEICRIVLASFDPNDKLVQPSGITDNRFISSNDRLEYTINFQNTGNDTAYLVVIRDTLPEFVNPATVQTGISSHHYTFSISEGGILEWRFENIFLVDSTTNESESHGYVMFKVNQDAGNPNGTRIENRAGIYFDFNEPVITEFAWNVVFDTTFTDTIMDGMEEVTSKSELAMSMYPNPTEAEVFLILEHSHKYQVQVLTLTGQVVQQASFQGTQGHVNLRNLNNGMYLLRVTDDSGKSVFGKVRKE